MKTSPTNINNAMKYFCLVLFLAFAFAGCKPKEKEQVIANKVVKSEQALITGQIFIVTKGRANVVLGDEKIALLDAHETRTYFNSKALEWSNALAMAQVKVDQATKSYELKNSSDARKQLDNAVKSQADLWDEINWPSADHFWPRIEITTTDSEGRFKFVVPKSSANLNLMLFAKAERQLGDEKENWWRMVNVNLNGRKTAELYWWMVNVNLNGRKTAEFVLSNDNSRDTTGVMGWFFDEKPMWNYMDKYVTKMDDAKAHRDFKDWEEKLNDGN